MSYSHKEKVDNYIARSGNRSGKQFTKDLSAAVANAKASLVDTVRAVALDLGSRVIQRTPVDTGRAKSNWRFSPGEIDTTMSSPWPRPKSDAERAEADATATREAMARLNAETKRWDPTRQKSFFITNTLPYIKRLEYGWSVKQAPKGMVRITVAEFLEITRYAVTFTRKRGGVG